MNQAVAVSPSATPARLLPLLLLGGLLAWPGQAAALGVPGFDVEAAVGVWNQNLGGAMSSNGADLDLERDLRLDGETRVTARALFEHPVPLLPDVKVQYLPFDQTADGTANFNFTYGDNNYTTGSAIHSRLEMDAYDLTLYYHLPLAELLTLDTLDVHFGANVRYVEGTASLESSTLGVADRKDFSAPVPMLYLGLEVEPLDWLKAVGELRGISLGPHHWVDATVGLQVAPFIDNIFLGVGYRYNSIRLDDVNSVNIDTSIKGAYAELGVRF